MSSSNKTGAPKAPTSSWNPLQRINRSRQQQAAVKAERQVNRQWLDAQRRRLQPAPTLPASPPCGGLPLNACARLDGPSYGGLPARAGALPHAASGYAQWHPDADAYTAAPRRGVGAWAGTLAGASKSLFKKSWRSTQRVVRQSRGEGASKRRNWKGIATAAAAGLAAGVLIFGAIHLAVAALAVGCMGLVAMLSVAAFKKRRS